MFITILLYSLLKTSQGKVKREKINLLPFKNIFHFEAMIVNHFIINFPQHIFRYKKFLFYFDFDIISRRFLMRF